MDKLYNISKTAEILDVTPKTLRVWDKEKKLKPIINKIVIMLIGKLFNVNKYLCSLSLLIIPP